MCNKLFLKTNFIIILVYIFTQCSNIDETKKDSVIIFPKNIETFGKAVANDLHKAIVTMHKAGINYSDANDCEDFTNKFFSDYYKAASTTLISKSALQKLQEYDNPTYFIKKYMNLTEIQKNYINRIINDVGETISYEDMRNKLTKITKDIYSEVPEFQQERLLRITSVLFYCANELEYLENQGQMILTPYSKLPKIKTRSENSGWGSSCRTFLATVWTIAVGEPTPAGEIVASVITVYIAGKLLYEVVVCRKSNRDDCQRKYEDCVEYNWQKDCSSCLQYCIVQGYWPSDRC